MRTVPFKTVVDAIIRLHGMDPRGDVPSDLLNAVVDHANARVETALLAWDWQEWNRTEERAYRQVWNAATQFKRVNGDGVPDELFYIPNMTYYRVLDTAVSDPPIGTLPTNTTYFTPITVLDTYLQYDQPCKRSIGQVLGIYSSDPRTSNCCSNYRSYKYHPSEMGVDICGSRGPTIFVLYQMPTPRYSMTPYLVGKTYNRGDVVFDPITGECYQALSTTTVAPATGPWNRVPFLQKWFNFVRYGAFADSLGENDQGGGDPNVKMALAANAEAKAMNALQQQIDSMVMQGEKLTWSFRSRSRHWCESVSWSGGTVSTLTDQCQADAGWVYPGAAGGGGSSAGTDINGVTLLVAGQNYIDVAFASPMTSVNWTFVELRVINTTDTGALNIWPGVVTSKTINGFRLQLNGVPDTGNYFLNWTVRGATGTDTGDATTYSLTGPTTGKIGVAAAFLVQLPSGKSVPGGGIMTVTPHASGAGGTFTPASVELTTLSPVASFTFTPSAYGVSTISVTNDKGLSDPANKVFTSVAGTYTLTGPSTGDVGIASTAFTVALPVGAIVLAPVTVTPQESAHTIPGTFSPTSVTLTTGSPSATFTFTPGEVGAKTISTTNNGGLTDPAGITYTATAASPHLLNNLISYWKLDEASGATTLADTHGSNPLTGYTANAFGGIINNAQYFNSAGVSAAHASNASLQVTGDFTFSVWVRVDDPANSRVILAKEDFGSNHDYQLTHNPSTGFGFNVNNAASNVSKGSVESAFSWHHVIAWYDSTDQKVRMRIDDAATYTAPTGGSLVQTGVQFCLSHAAGSVNWSGLMDEVGFWKRKLTAGEMTALYNGGAGKAYSTFTS